MGKRLETLLTDAGIDEGETTYSLKRGGMQHAAAQGDSVEFIAHRALIKTSSIVYQRYLHPTRHIGRIGRKPKARPSKKATA